MSYGQLRDQQCDVQIRWMIRRDMVEVLEIEQATFEFAWTEEDFLCCLRQRNCIGMVAELDDRIVGYMVYELLKSRLHLLNFAVTESQRRRRVGTQMLDKLLGKLAQQRRHELTLEVRETNIVAQKFFRQRGLKATSVVRNYYSDSTEDAYVMRYALDNDPLPMLLAHNRLSAFERHESEYEDA